jgi:hypothetical protein
MLMFDASSEAEAQDRMTSEGGPPPRRAATGFRRDAAFQRLRALIAGLGDVRSIAGTRVRVARPVAARLKAARLRRAALRP